MLHKKLTRVDTMQWILVLIADALTGTYILFRTVIGLSYTGLEHDER